MWPASWGWVVVFGGGVVVPPQLVGCGGVGCVVRRRLTLPHTGVCSTISAGRLNFRVRDGSGCFPLAMATVTKPLKGFFTGCSIVVDTPVLFLGGVCFGILHSGRVQNSLVVLLVWQALGLLVSVSFTHYCASTSDLSTPWSAGGLTTLTVWESSS